jgi:prefoldin beta subunit
MTFSLPELERAAKAVEEARAKLQELIERRVQVSLQQKECETVLDSFEFMNETDVVYKQVGPALVKQELASAKENVTQRIQHIKETLATLETTTQEAQRSLAAAEEHLQQVQPPVK